MNKNNFILRIQMKNANIGHPVKLGIHFKNLVRNINLMAIIFIKTSF